MRSHSLIGELYAVTFSFYLLKKGEIIYITCKRSGLVTSEKVKIRTIARSQPAVNHILCYFMTDMLRKAKN